MERIQCVLKNVGNLNALKRKLGIGGNVMHALILKECNATTNMDKVAEVAEDFYRNL